MKTSLAEINAVRDAHDLVQVIGKEIPLYPAGGLWVGRCPFCAAARDHHFQVHPRRQTFHCLACHADGDLFAWMQRFRGLSFAQALEQLRHGTAEVAA